MFMQVRSRIDSKAVSVDEPSEDQAKPEPNSPLWLRMVRGSIFWIVLAVAGLLIWLSGLAVFPVKTGSMRPTIQPGDVVVAINSDLVQPTVGSIVIAEPEVNGQQLPAIAHRVIAVNPDGTLKTKGDYNPEPDAWVDRPEDVQKTVILHVPMNWAKSPLVIAGGLGVLSLIILWPSKKKEADDAPDGSTAGTGGPDPDEPDASAPDAEAVDLGDRQESDRDLVILK